MKSHVPMPVTLSSVVHSVHLSFKLAEQMEHSFSSLHSRKVPARSRVQSEQMMEMGVFLSSCQMGLKPF